LGFVLPMNDTPNLALPYILAAQAQKHVTHNEAIRAIDCLVHLSVASRTLTEPPASPDNGSRYIVAAGAGGSWAGHDGKVAAYQDGAWAFYAPKTGWCAWIEDDEKLRVWSGSDWIVAVSGGGGGGIEAPVANADLASMPAGTIKGNNTGGSAKAKDLTATEATAMLDVAVGSGTGHSKGLVPDPGGSAGTAKFLREDMSWAAPPSGGGDIEWPTAYDDLGHVGINATADSTNVLAIKGPASLFDNGGAGHQQKINKKTAGDTASVLYQTNYSGRAEMGLAGDDDFHFKVSPNGSTWYEAIKIDQTTGRVDFPKTNLTQSRNRALNPCGAIAQAGLASATDGNYTGFDQWYALTQTGAVTPSQLTDVADCLPTMMRLTQAQATAQRFGIAQPLESSFIKDLRGKTVALAAKVRMSAATTLRYAILEWTGTADTITRDVVADWSKTTFTAGQFFAASNVTVAAAGALALSSNTLTDIALSATLSSSLNNAIVFFWTDSTQAQNVTFDIGNVWFGQGSSVPAMFDPPNPTIDLVSCQRLFQKLSGPASFSRLVTAIGLARSATLITFSCYLRTQMRMAPSITASASNAFLAYDSTNALVASANSFVDISTDAFTLEMTVSGAVQYRTYIISTNNNSAHYIMLDARL